MTTTPRKRRHPVAIIDVKKWSIRMILAAAVAAAFLFLVTPWEYPELLLPGGFLITLGTLIRIWGTGHLRKNKVLACGGPYAWVRHPLYVGTFLIVIGLGLMSGSEIVLLGFLPASILIFFLYYAPKKERVEADRLRRRFGDEFDRFRAEVPAYFPRLTPWPERRGKWALEGVMINREYWIVVATLLAVAVILARYWLKI